jgi:hypothetical protein
MDSTSPTWSLVAVTLEDIVSDALKFHVGVQIGDVETLDLYIAKTGLISRRRVALFLLSTGATVRN